MVGQVFCYVMYFLYDLSFLCSVFTMTVMNLERYRTVIYCKACKHFTLHFTCIILKQIDNIGD